ncbi:hypothetical protein TNCV_2271341 [Trichonephila clavipes]|nr:hypothetical protein TNCV_2271341 [Trichonephila clavipes]
MTQRHPYRSADCGKNAFFFLRHYSTHPVTLSWCTRNDGNDIPQQQLGGGKSSSLFPSNALLCYPSSCARGTMTTTSYRSRSAVFITFSVEHYPCYCPSRLEHAERWQRHPTAARRWGSYPFSVEALLYRPVASWCTRKRWQRHPTAAARRWVFVTFSVEALHFAVWSRLAHAR